MCKLNKALYGLKQVPQAWYYELRNFLLGLGFENARSDTSLFTFIKKGRITYILVYVDDLIVTSNDDMFPTQLITQLALHFSLKDLGPLAYFLGVEVVCSTSDLFLHRRSILSIS